MYRPNEVVAEEVEPAEPKHRRPKMVIRRFRDVAEAADAALQVG
jgi:hypothetical protein